MWGYFFVWELKLKMKNYYYIFLYKFIKNFAYCERCNFFFHEFIDHRIRYKKESTTEQ